MHSGLWVDYSGYRIAWKESEILYRLPDAGQFLDADLVGTSNRLAHHVQWMLLKTAWPAHHKNVAGSG